MNERIKQLAEQATEYANQQNELHGVGYVITFKEKFAELIVNDAVELVRDIMRDEESELSLMAGAEVQARMREYFGVNNE